MPQPSAAPNRLNGTQSVCVVCVHRTEDGENRYPCGFLLFLFFLMENRDGEGGLCTRETCGGSEEEKWNGCERKGIGESDRHTHWKQPKKLGGLKFSSYISLSVSQECCLCPRERREQEGGSSSSHHIHILLTHYTGETRKKKFCANPSHMHTGNYVLRLAFLA